jgi:hypothetical protein
LPPLPSLGRSLPSLSWLSSLSSLSSLSGLATRFGIDPRVALAAGGGLLLLVVMALGISRLGGGDEGSTPSTVATGAAGAGKAAGAPPSVAPVEGVPPFEAGEMPELRGVRRAQAEETLSRLGLTFVVMEVNSTSAPAGVVFDQSPPAGREARAGDHATLIVSKGPPAAP